MLYLRVKIGLKNENGIVLGPGVMRGRLTQLDNSFDDAMERLRKKNTVCFLFIQFY